MTFTKNMRKSTTVAFSVLASMGIFCASAHAGNVSVLNCTKNAATVAAYNSDDSVMLIAYKSACVQGNGQTASVSCATSKCHLKVWLTTCRPGPSGFLVTQLRRSRRAGPVGLLGSESKGAGVSGQYVLLGEQLYSMNSVVESSINAGIVPAGTTSVSCDQIRRLPGSMFR